MTSLELGKNINDYIFAFSKICPNCGCRFKDTLDRMILCKECDREDKIKKLLND